MELAQKWEANASWLIASFRWPGVQHSTEFVAAFGPPTVGCTMLRMMAAPQGTGLSEKSENAVR